jgi:hypothetical protein
LKWSFRKGTRGRNKLQPTKQLSFDFY